MSGKQLAKDVKKHVAAIRISNEIGLIPRKMWNVLLLNAYDSLLTRQEHVISIAVLSDAIGYNSRNYERLREALEKLSSTSVSWDVGGRATEAGLWSKNFSFSSLLSWGKVEDGTLYYGFSPILAEMLYNPEIYQRISIAQQRLFTSSYALALWENCMRFSSVGSTGMFDIEEWRVLLGATAKTYDEYKRLSQKVLGPAIKEVNAVSNIELALKVKRVNRKVAQLSFVVKTKETGVLMPPEKMVGIVDSDEFKALIQHGIAEVQAKLWIQEHGFDYIKDKLRIVDERLANKTINSSVAGFLATAIRNDFKSEKTDQKSNDELLKERRERSANVQRAKEKLIRQFETMIKAEFIASLSLEAKQQLLDEIYTAKQDDLFIREEVKRLGLDSPFIGIDILQRVPDYKVRRDKYVKEELAKQNLPTA